MMAETLTNGQILALEESLNRITDTLIQQNLHTQAIVNAIEHLDSKTDWINTIATVFIAIFTVISTIYIVLNIINDKAKVEVHTSLNQRIINDPRFDKNKYYMSIMITNTGRKPVYVGSVYLKTKDGTTSYLGSSESRILAPESFYACLVDESSLDHSQIKNIIISGIGKKEYSFDFQKTLSQREKNKLIENK